MVCHITIQSPDNRVLTVSGQDKCTYLGDLVVSGRQRGCMCFDTFILHITLLILSNLIINQ